MFSFVEVEDSYTDVNQINDLFSFYSHRCLSLSHPWDYSIESFFSSSLTMFAVVIKSLWAVANNLLINQPNTPVQQATVPRWRRWSNAFLSFFSRVGLPLLNDTVYDYVNTVLVNQTPRRPHDHQPLQREHEHRINRLSRANFRRRSNRHHRSNIRIIKPTINITFQRS